jgi:hypothetical protein
MERQKKSYQGCFFLLISGNTKQMEIKNPFRNLLRFNEPIQNRRKNDKH